MSFFNELFGKKEQPVVENEEVTPEENTETPVETKEEDPEAPAVETEGENPDEKVPGSVE